MNILIAEERKSLLSALKLLLESEIDQIDYIREVSDRRDLNKAVEAEKPDILIMDGDFFNGNTKNAVISFKKYHPDMSLVIIGFDHGEKKKYLKLNVDLFITKGIPSARVLNSLIDFVKKKIG
jgi:DNA-binding NarL/FixJ family response regulator